ncbi:HEAT repeat domain-containing protein [Salinadaptatus halalkaliphilus]|nr:HEAT repeat domain-containing protein [Salinadaptatus halalkaliphilus]
MVELHVGDGEETIHATSWTKPRPSALPIDAPLTRDFTTAAGDTRRIQLPDISDVTVLEEATASDSDDASSGPDIDLPNKSALRGRAEQAEYLTTAQRVEFTIDVLKTAMQLSAYPALLLRKFARNIDASDISEDTSSPVTHASTYAAQHPEHLGRHVEDLARLTGVSNTDVRNRATWCLMTLAEEDPAAAIDAVPSLISALDTDETTREYATYTLARISDAYPEELLPGLSTLLDQLDTENATIGTSRPV